MNDQDQAKIGALRVLVETYYDVQDQRIRSANRIRKYNEISEAGLPQLEGWHDEIDKRMSSSEGFLIRRVQKLINDEPIWSEWLVDVRGVGPCIAGGLIAWLNPHKAAHASSFWKYCGQAVIDGEADRRHRGQKLSYNPKLKLLCWKLGQSFVKQTTPEPAVYRQQYDHFRAQVDAKPCNKVHIIEGKKLECFDAHKFAKAKRMTVKLFLAHLWTVWRKIEGLHTDSGVGDSYAHTVLKHQPSSYVPPIRDKGDWVGRLAA